MVLYAYAAMMPGEIDEEGQPLIDPRVTPTDMEIKNIIKISSKMPCLRLGIMILFAAIKRLLTFPFPPLFLTWML
jgi:hypothetical protein